MKSWFLILDFLEKRMTFKIVLGGPPPQPLPRFGVITTAAWKQVSGDNIKKGCCCCRWVPKLCLTLWPHGLWPARLLSPWAFPGKDTGVGCHFLLQGIFLTQGSNPRLLHWWVILYHWATREALRRDDTGLYWELSGSVRSYGKPWMNFLANTVFSKELCWTPHANISVNEQRIKDAQRHCDGHVTAFHFPFKKSNVWRSSWLASISRQLMFGAGSDIRSSYE